MGWFGLLAAIFAIAPLDPSGSAAEPEPATEGDAPEPEKAEDDPQPAEEESPSAPARVVLLSVAGTRDPGLVTRIRRARAELDVAGFDVLEVTSTASDVPDDATAIARWAADTEARVVATFDPTKVRAQVWLRGDSGEYERIAIVVGDLGSRDADAVFAVRLSEVVRAALIDVETPPAVVPKEPAPVVEPPAPPAPVPMRWGVRAGAHVLASSGRMGPMVGPTLGSTIALGPRRRFALDVELAATALQGSRTTEGGTAQLGLGVARVHAGVWPWPTARVSPGFGAGVGALVAWTRGRGAGDFVGRTDVTAVALPSIATDLAIGLTKRLRLRFGARLGVALPAIRIHTPEGTVRAAQPLFDGGVALEVKG